VHYLCRHGRHPPGCRAVCARDALAAQAADPGARSDDHSQECHRTPTLTGGAGSRVVPGAYANAEDEGGEQGDDTEEGEVRAGGSEVDLKEESDESEEEKTRRPSKRRKLSNGTAH
jgi:hypothetical protein